MKTPYLLRDSYTYGYFTNCIVWNSERFTRHGSSAPAVPLLTVDRPVDPGGVSATDRLMVLQERAMVLFHLILGMIYGRQNACVGQTKVKVGACLTALPRELVLQIMSELPASSLYCLRQTSKSFRLWFELSDFQRFHHVHTSPSSYIGFTMDISVVEKNDIANSLHHDEYCVSCLAAEEMGILDNGLTRLRQLRYCEGCDRLHASALFFPGKSPARCIGLLGHVKVCHHRSARVTTWIDICDTFAKYRYIDRRSAYGVVCTSRSHQPAWEENDKWTSHGCSFPRLVVKDTGTGPSVVQLAYGWDLPLLRITALQRPTLAVVRQVLSEVVLDAFSAHSMCPHVTAERDIQDYIQSGICECFTRIGYIPIDRKFEPCKCQRQVNLECRVCGAVYTWLNYGGSVTLSYQYVWRVQRPTSPGWLGLIDQGFKRMLFSEENRNILWCETPGCRTNTRGRWEAIVKADSERGYMEASDDEASHHYDYIEAMFASHESSFQNW
ncbi:hypothetical protein ED733_005348 [Metarhizium rileyi]|uniref:F-box domain-containing protein n=1 Tax=Metarhizium rileyi (strain RCEF 4871) TaxID=1649241 RepID=A0A5C6GL65_METRR|nr:hypothetical protein ED733_005348 [Metarhizium rileyi]